MKFLTKQWKRVGLYLLVVGVLVYVYPRSYAVGYIKGKFINYQNKISAKEGDFVFQNLSGLLTEIIAAVTESPYSHCGIVVKKNDKFYVLEAIGPVKETPLNEWVARGYAQKITLIRFKEKYQSQIKPIVVEAYKYKGLPYDSRYEWDDEKIYCSELIYKAVLGATGLKIANFVELKDLNWQPYEKYIRYLDGGGLPLERKMVMPVSIVESESFDVVYSNF